MVNLKCCPCTDKALTDGIDLADLNQIPQAVTMAPSAQTFTINGQQIMAPVVIPVCLDCRRNQLGVTSKRGLVVA